MHEIYGDSLPAHVILTAGILSSCFAQLISYPFALVRTRMQAQAGLGTF